MSENISSAFICDFVGCKKYFKEPITLPCGDTVCKEHVNHLETSFKCPICTKEFIILEEGFCVNRKINALIKENSHLTGQYKEVKDMFDKLEKLIGTFEKSNSANPQLYIHEYFAAIRNKIDLHREQMLDSIQKRSEELLNKLKEMEQECYQNEVKIEKINLKKEKKDEVNSFSEQLRLTNP